MVFLDLTLATADTTNCLGWHPVFSLESGVSYHDDKVPEKKLETLGRLPAVWYASTKY